VEAGSAAGLRSLGMRGWIIVCMGGKNERKRSLGGLETAGLSEG
jgi:hypothetical protein